MIGALLAVAALLAALLFVSIRSVADTAVETTQDSILGAAAIAIAEELRGGDEGLSIDIPYTSFAMLGSIGEDRVFYRILVDGVTATGYADLPLPPAAPATGLAPVFYTATYDQTEVRLAAVSRSVVVARRAVVAQVIIAQTRSAKDAIVAQMAARAAALGLGFFAVAAILSLIATRAVLQPLSNLADAVGRRGPDDLRPIERPVPVELAPFVRSLNGFIGRLATALSRTETFIAEAAHHIRTPLATLRAQAETALRRSEDDATREALRGMIRAADDSARRAGQLLDHAAVVYRSDQRSEEPIDLAALCADIVTAYAPAAAMRDIDIHLHGPDSALTLRADRLLVESAIRNLVDNAIKYSDADSAIDITLARDGRRAHIAVADRGRGLEGARTPHLTARLKRGRNVADVVGSGLGLTIVREVVRAQDGAFSIEDREGGGTCANLWLPLA